MDDDKPTGIAAVLCILLVLVACAWMLSHSTGCKFTIIETVKIDVPASQPSE